jgi:hypothetical protein
MNCRFNKLYHIKNRRPIAITTGLPLSYGSSQVFRRAHDLCETAAQRSHKNGLNYVCGYGFAVESQVSRRAAIMEQDIRIS